MDANQATFSQLVAGAHRGNLVLVQGTDENNQPVGIIALAWSTDDDHGFTPIGTVDPDAATKLKVHPETIPFVG